MSVLIFRALWGMTGALPEQIERIAAAGYDGVEAWWSALDVNPTHFRQLLDAHHLKLVMAANVDTQTDIEPTLMRLVEYEPLRINLHSGRDHWTFDDGCTFFEEALRVESFLDLPVMHETHRGRLLFTPWHTAEYLRHFETLKITADYSHWVNVCERLLDDQAEALALANQHAVHIHGRVGYEEGPQVPDPAAPEYAAQLAWHERQWGAIKIHRDNLEDFPLTFTPEYGPPPYLHTLPGMNTPVADIWDVALWAMRRARVQLS
jgi:sugar phosphate isomerase/epimerase